MQADLRDFETGWYGITLGVKSEEIDDLIAALRHLKSSKDHFHFRSEFEGGGEIGDIEFYYQASEGDSNLELEFSNLKYPSD